MARVVLHIGTHKTATTTIQDMFAHNAGLLAANGLIYPRLDYPQLPGSMTGHHGLVMDWNRVSKLYELPAGSQGTLRQIARDHAGGEATVFLSSEEFSRGSPKGRTDFTALRQALAGFDRVEVVCVLREQWQFLQSAYIEISKSRRPPRPMQFVDAALHSDMIEGLWTDYNLLYDHLLDSFAANEITFLDYDSCRRAKGGILGCFLNLLGLPLAAGDLEPVNAGHSNASPPALPTWVANVVAEPQRAPYWLLEAMAGAFVMRFGETARSLLWSQDEFAMLQAYANERNARLAARLAPVQPGFALSATQPAATDIHREDLDADFWLQANRWAFDGIRRQA